MNDDIPAPVFNGGAGVGPKTACFLTGFCGSPGKSPGKGPGGRPGFQNLAFWNRLGFFLFLFALILPGCRPSPKQGEAEAPRPVRGVVVGERNIPHEISGFGTLSFLKKVDVAAPQDAVLAALYYREGDKVNPGDKLALLENPQISLAVGRAQNTFSQAKASLDLARSRLLEGEFQAEAQLLNLEKAEAELEQARKIHEEQKRKHQGEEALYEAGGVTEEAIRTGRFSLDSEEEKIRLLEKDLAIRRIGFRHQDLAAAGLPLPRDEGEQRRLYVALATATLRAEFQAAQASLQAAAKELESAKLAESELVVRSSMAGTVGALYMEAGERVKQEDKILTLMDTESLYGVFPVREEDALRLEKGMAAVVSLDGTGGTYEGSVELVAPIADSQSFTFSVRVLLSPESIAGGMGETLPKPGMFARVSITLGPPRKVMVIPDSAILNKKNNQGVVFVINGDTVHERELRFGMSLGEDREIEAGLLPGDLVVARPDGGLRDGVYVSVVE
ncbi:MAG: efflux RND transporter periplasmic adaptor subunit [Treponema sp.]|jgi:RND family efflux transporter MFP subunit|nr:efflux RND transporter periplasmic adaptor subunit [Treponema sp.]